MERTGKSEDSITPEEQTELVDAEAVVHEEPFLKFSPDGLALSVRRRDVRDVRQMGLPPNESA